MSTLILTAANQVGSSLIRTAGQVALSFASRTLSNAFDNRIFEGPRLDSFHIQTSRDGAPMPRVFGRNRLAGQIIWASKLRETATETQQGGKGGGPVQRNYSYSISFAIGLCEGEILSVERLWANGAPLPIADYVMRVYKGDDVQLPDPVIAAIDGPDAPAFRGTSYIVFEDFPLDNFGFRIPQINAEILRIPPTLSHGQRMEDLIQGVNLLPSSGEFAYATSIIEDEANPGQTRPINLNNLSGKADIERAIDQLENQLPNCKNVSLVVSWFGTDLRCGDCEIRPGAEQRIRVTPDAEWSVGPETREIAYPVSRDNNDRPVFGGTPSDHSIIESIKMLKQRGFKVTIYPFILMDIPPDNQLPDPYGRDKQPPFPWRGRITCDPAPDRVGTPDKSVAIHDQIDTFFGNARAVDFSVQDNRIDYNGPNEYGFNRFILHYATLAELAGGVDRFIIGTEMRGVTTLRESDREYPAVTKLKNLAADVKLILGNATKLSYAADWTEYFGHHPQDGSGNVMYHLDPLWSDPNIDAVGIDAYFPLSDWRDNDNHIDALSGFDEYDLDYLSSNMLGGEGYDWFYANQNDRDNQIRTPISDGVYQKPWVFRYKDIRNWWDNEHYNRLAGVEDDIPTHWHPQSKPFWFLEVGCPAVDKGANQPNVFFDPKSDESAVPYFSNGQRDDLIQRRYIEAFLDFWQLENLHNPLSQLTGEPMVDMDSLHIWCWDARPFPDFPARGDIWADGSNWELGHWLTGRTGIVPLADVVSQLAQNSGAVNIDVSRLSGLVEGYIIDRPMSARAAIEPLSTAYGFNLIERAGHLSFVTIGSETSVNLTAADIVLSIPSTVMRSKEDSETALRDVRVHFVNAEQDYQVGVMSAQNRNAETQRILDLNAPIVMAPEFAQSIAERSLATSLNADETLNFQLPRSNLTIEVGDVVSLPDVEGRWHIEELESQDTAIITSRRYYVHDRLPVSISQPTNLPPIPWIPRAEIIVLDIPGEISADSNREGPFVGVAMQPFSPTRLRSPVGNFVDLDSLAILGRTETSLLNGPYGRWDFSNQLIVSMPGLMIGSLDGNARFSENRFAIETKQGWEIFSARNAVLVAPDTYELSGLLRGLGGSIITDDVAEGARIIWLGQGFKELAVPAEYLAEDLIYIAETGGRSITGKPYEYFANHLRPLKPVHLSLKGTRLNWIRQTRTNGDSWAGLDVPLGEEIELYRIQLFNAEGLVASYETSDVFFDILNHVLSELTYIEISQASSIVGWGNVGRLKIN